MLRIKKKKKKIEIFSQMDTEYYTFFKQIKRIRITHESTFIYF